MSALHKQLKPSDYLSFKQQESLIIAKQSSNIYCLLNINPAGAAYISINRGLMLTIPEGFGLIELTKFAAADALLASEAIRELNRTHKLDFVSEEAFNRILNRNVKIAAIETPVDTTAPEADEEALEEKGVESTLVNYEDLTIEELKALCTGKKISFSHNSKKETLVRKLQEQAV
jgi:hypothetical protein